jgi:glycosyltransferase involved in cell wall biosynthesis
MNVSIVIPVYNEAEHLAACLEAISRQSVLPHEVIVVDNNSSDGTAAIALSFPFVQLLTEEKQGVVHARNRGFDAASGEIIGRIDADTLLPTDWVQRIQSIFAASDVSAVSGSAHYYDFALAALADRIDFGLRGHLARKLGQDNFLWGANMAVRRSDWQAVRQNLCDAANMHEDFDLGIHLQAQGLRVDYDQNLLAGVSSRRVDTSFRSFVSYSLVSPKTYAAHGLKSGRHMYPVLFVCWAAYLPARLVYKGYNHETGSFSLSQLLTATNSRVDPTANIA